MGYKHRSKWPLRPGSRFFWPIFEGAFLEYCRNRSPNYRSQKFRRNMKIYKKYTTIIAHTYLLHLHCGSLWHFYHPPLHTPMFLYPPDWFEICGFFSRTDHKAAVLFVAVFFFFSVANAWDASTSSLIYAMVCNVALIKFVVCIMNSLMVLTDKKTDTRQHVYICTYII